MFPGDNKQQRFWAAIVLLVWCFKAALAAPLACCIAAETGTPGEECHGAADVTATQYAHSGHSGHGAAAENAETLAACAFHQCCVITTGLNGSQPPQAVMVLLVSEVVATEQMPWGDARIISSYLSRGPPALTLI